jgi:hypothetical protein
MKWFRIFGPSLLTNPKWLALTMEERGAWITVMANASAMEPPWTFRDIAHVTALLRREGAAEAESLIGRLIEERLLDVCGDSQIEIHDYDQWQVVYPSDRPEATRERKQRSRAAKKAAHTAVSKVTSGHDAVTSGREPDRQTDVDRETDRHSHGTGFGTEMIKAGLSPELVRTLGIDDPEP